MNNEPRLLLIVFTTYRTGNKAPLFHAAYINVAAQTKAVWYKMTLVARLRTPLLKFLLAIRRNALLIFHKPSHQLALQK